MPKTTLESHVSQRSIRRAANERLSVRVAQPTRTIFSVWHCLVGAMSVGFAATAELVSGQSTGDAVRVQAVLVAQEQTVRSITQPASIEPWYRAEIRSRVTAYVTDVKADIGTVVNRGDVLATLDAPEMVAEIATIEARIDRLLAEEERAKAETNVAKANVQSAAAILEQAKAQLAMDDAAVKAAGAELERISDLVRRKVSEPRLQDEATQRSEAAAAGRSASESAIRSAEAGLSVANSRTAAAAAALKVAQAETQIARMQLKELQAEMDYLKLQAPFDGVITHRQISPGDLVAAGRVDGEPLFEIIQLQKVRCRIDIPERDAAFVRPGDAVSLSLPAFADENFEIRVSRTAQTLNSDTRTMRIEADIDNKDARLLPGMFGQATVSLGTPVTAGVLPSRAVRFDSKGQAFVYVIRPDETVAVTSVAVVSDNGQTISLTGLTAGQRVIDAHLKRFIDGQKVQVVD